MNIAMILFYPFRKRYNAYSTWSFLANVVPISTALEDEPLLTTSKEGDAHCHTVSFVFVTMMR